MVTIGEGENVDRNWKLTVKCFVDQSQLAVMMTSSLYPIIIS